MLRRNGTYRLTARQENELNNLFELFGLEARVTDPRFRDLSELAQLWGRFSTYFGKFIKYANEAPSLYVALTREWPERYQEYLVAVLTGDVQTASRLSKELALENMSIKLPLPAL